jgi:SOS-response transcriptional repressor LexA
MSESADLGNCSASEPFALRVIGDDMLPEFKDGHIIIIDPGGRVTSGCYVIAKLQDEMIFRQLIAAEDGWLLHALDARIVDIPLVGDIVDHIVGVVSQRSGKRRSEHKRYDV